MFFWWDDRNRKLHTSFVINHSFQQLPNNKAVFTIKNDLKIFSLSPLLVLPIEKYTEANRETGRACNFAWEVANWEFWGARVHCKCNQLSHLPRAQRTVFSIFPDMQSCEAQHHDPFIDFSFPFPERQTVLEKGCLEVRPNVNNAVRTAKGERERKGSSRGSIAAKIKGFWPRLDFLSCRDETFAVCVVPKLCPRTVSHFGCRIGPLCTLRWQSSKITRTRSWRPP